MELKKGVLLFVCFISISLQIGFAQYNALESCYKNNIQGYCIQLRQCPALLQLISRKPIRPQDTDYLRRSHCGFEGKEPKVCCDPNDPANQQQGTGSRVNEGNTNGNSNNFNQNGGSTNLLPDTKNCGKSLDDRIYGGEKTTLLEFPWMALLEYTKPNGKGFYCGGVLINQRYVLTAAHCLKSKDLPKTWRLSSVRLGEYDTTSDVDCIDWKNGESDCQEQKPIDIPVEERIAHENYDPNDTNQYHDIALLRLSRPVTYNDYIKPICLPSASTDLAQLNIGANMSVAGWGKTETRSESNVKLKVTVPVKSNQECNSVYKSARVTLGNGQMCAGGDKGRDSCRGDSGGPLMSVDKNTGNWFAAGIVSFGPLPCGMAGWPGVYTKVNTYVSWISENLKP